MVPVTGGINPAIDRSSVDLPHPEGPRTETKDPAAIFKVRASSITLSLNLVVKFSI
jgi:hypothetical protein